MRFYSSCGIPHFFGRLAMRGVFGGIFKKKAGFDWSTVRKSDRIVPYQEHRKENGLALPVRLRTGGGGKDRPSTERSCQKLRSPMRFEEKRLEKDHLGAWRPVQPDLCGRHLRGNAAGEYGAQKQHQRRSRRGMACVQRHMAGKYLLQGQAVLSWELRPARGRDQGAETGGRTNRRAVFSTI